MFVAGVGLKSHQPQLSAGTVNNYDADADAELISNLSSVAERR